MKRALGDRFTIYGVLDTQPVLPEGPPEDVRILVDRRLCERAPSGGFILGPAMEIQHDVPLEDLLTLIDPCQEQQSSLYYRPKGPQRWSDDSSKRETWGGSG